MRGEARRKRLALRNGAGEGCGNEPLVVDTLRGRIRLRWDETAAAKCGLRMTAALVIFCKWPGAAQRDRARQ